VNRRLNRRPPPETPQAEFEGRLRGVRALCEQEAQLRDGLKPKIFAEKAILEAEIQPRTAKAKAAIGFEVAVKESAEGEASRLIEEYRKVSSARLEAKTEVMRLEEEARRAQVEEESLRVDSRRCKDRLVMQTSELMKLKLDSLELEKDKADEASIVELQRAAAQKSIEQEAVYKPRMIQLQADHLWSRVEETETKIHSAATELLYSKVEEKRILSRNQAMAKAFQQIETETKGVEGIAANPQTGIDHCNDIVRRVVAELDAALRGIENEAEIAKDNVKPPELKSLGPPRKTYRESAVEAAQKQGEPSGRSTPEEGSHLTSDERELRALQRKKKVDAKNKVLSDHVSHWLEEGTKQADAEHSYARDKAVRLREEQNAVIENRQERKRSEVLAKKKAEARARLEEEALRGVQRPSEEAVRLEVGKAREKQRADVKNAVREYEFRSILQENEAKGGQKEVLGLWIREAEAEAARMQMEIDLERLKEGKPPLARGEATAATTNDTAEATMAPPDSTEDADGSNAGMAHDLGALKQRQGKVREEFPPPGPSQKGGSVLEDPTPVPSHRPPEPVLPPVVATAAPHALERRPSARGVRNRPEHILKEPSQIPHPKDARAEKAVVPPREERPSAPERPPAAAGDPAGPPRRGQRRHPQEKPAKQEARKPAPPHPSILQPSNPNTTRPVPVEPAASENKVAPPEKKPEKKASDGGPKEGKRGKRRQQQQEKKKEEKLTEPASGAIKYRVPKEAPPPQEDLDAPLPRNELPPLADPEAAMKACAVDMRGSDWEAQSRAIAATRRVMHHHLSVASANGKVLFRDLLALADSLRSSVARVALVAVTEALESFKGLVNDELNNAVAKLLKRACDVNHFISAEADRALEAAASFPSASKYLQVILPHMSHRSSGVRSKAARGTVIAVKRLGGKVLSKSKDPEELVKVLLKGLDDSNRDVRSFSRDALVAMHQTQPEEVAKLAERAQPEKGRNRLLKIAEKPGGGEVAA